MKIRTLNKRYKSTNRKLSLPFISSNNNSPTRKSPGNFSPKKSTEEGTLSPSFKRVLEKRILDLENAKKKRKSTPELKLQITSKYTHSFDNPLDTIKTRPRFLGGQYTSKRSSYVKSNYDSVSRIKGTKERSSVENECKNQNQKYISLPLYI